MSGMISVFASHAVLRVLAAFLSVGMVKGCLIVLAAYLACRWLCARQPARAHTVWLLTLLALLLVPLAWLALPPVPPALPFAAPAVGAAMHPGPAAALSPSRIMGLADTTGGYEALARHSFPGRFPFAGQLLLAAWGIGTGVLLVRAAVGRIMVRASLRGSPLPPVSGRLAQELRRKLSVRAAVRFVISPRCGVPFTHGIRRPLVVLPAAAASWSPDLLRPVLLHELAHVKRRDSLFSMITTLLTAPLWCFPPAWVAASFLARTRERACDQLVLDHGVPAPQYASAILRLVRGSRGTLLVPAEWSSLGRKSMLRERFASLLGAGAAGRPSAVPAANRLLVGAFCCLLPLFALTCAGAPRAGLEPLLGTWTNAEYFGTYWTHTFAFNPDGRETWYEDTAADSPTGEARFVIETRRVDADGAAWYRVSQKCSYVPYNEEVARATWQYSLLKLDPGGDRLEVETSQMRWPESFGDLGSHHYVYYRKQ
jgi:beta-lactamase regulating signal transducer with metallopeptidase domain